MKQRYMDFVPAVNRQTGQVASARRMVTATGSAPTRRMAGRVTSTKEKSGSAKQPQAMARPMRAVRPQATARPAKTVRPSETIVKPAAAKVTRPQTAVKPADAAEGVRPKAKKEKPRAEEKPRGLRRFSLRRNEKKAESGPKLGEVADWSNRFVNTDVPKRPLAKTEARPMQQGVSGEAELMSGKRRAVGSAKKTTGPMTKTTGSTAKTTGATRMAGPARAAGVGGGRNFVYQQKIEKRPLSKVNVYGKKPMVARPMSKEEPKGPVTIISKPEKQSHVGIIVAIILTIILGAAAGTVAFLILPK